MEQQFNFYLLDQSFEAPDDLELNKLKAAVEQLADDCDYIREFDNNNIFRHEGIYEVILFNQIELYKIIYTEEYNHLLTRDQRFSLSSIIDKSQDSGEVSCSDVIELLESHDENDVYGLLCLHEIKDINTNYLIYNKNNWFEFHHYFLGKYFFNEEYFYSECVKYFPKLYFHSEIKNSLLSIEGGLSKFVKAIIYSLKALSNDFKTHYQHSNIPSTLKAFSSAVSIETTLEGDAKRKIDFTFSFKKNNQSDETEDICCEPHMKLCTSDIPSEKLKHYFNRIYFHVGDDRIQEGRILIGHIGNHL